MAGLSYRILFIGETRLGCDARGAFMSLMRLGHSVYVIDEYHYYPLTWRSAPARIVRKLIRPMLVRELMLEARRLARVFEPHSVFVFKGNSVHPGVIGYYKKHGIPCVNFYPDISFRTHGRYLPKTLPLYDHIFTTKSWGIADMQSQLGVKSVSFLEHGFDPEIHRPLSLTHSDRVRYGCDAVFIGTWSPKKEAVLADLLQKLPPLRMKIWGLYWAHSRSPALKSCIMGDEVIGEEYSRALQASSICLGLLSERRTGASSGDFTTSRTFNIPACGAFLLHERNEEALRYFKEGEEAAFFDSYDELAAKVSYYLNHPTERNRIAHRGWERCQASKYSLDDRMSHLVKWLDVRLSPRTSR